MDRAEAIERFEKQLTAAQVVLDSGFGTNPGENNRLYVMRKEMAAIALEALRGQELARNSHDVTRSCEWISVEDALPGTERVLVTNGEFVKEGYRRPDGVWKYGKEEHMRWERLSCHPVTHWMPLPKPPTEGGDFDGETKPVVTRCSLCKTPIYIKVKRYMKPVLAPLTREQELRDRLVDMTGEDYAELSGGFCPGCGGRKEGGGEG